MKTTYLLACCLFVLLSSCKKEDKKEIEQLEPDYREKWVGDYQGVAYYSYSNVNGSNKDTSDVTVNVSKATRDSSLNILIDYADWGDKELEKIKVLEDGFYRDSSGVGSGTEIFDLYIMSDTLKVFDFRRCGIYCGIATQFKIAKQ